MDTQWIIWFHNESWFYDLPVNSQHGIALVNSISNAQDDDRAFTGRFHWSVLHDSQLFPQFLWVNPKKNR